MSGWEASWGKFGDQVKRDIEHLLTNSRWGFVGYSGRACILNVGGVKRAN